MNPQYSSSETMGRAGGYSWSAGVEVQVAKSLAVAAEYSTQRAIMTHWLTGPAGPVPTTSRDVLHPIDLLGRYTLATGERWRPYVGAGARAFDLDVEPVPVAGMTSRAKNGWNIAPEANAGVTFQIHPQLGLVFDAKYVLTEQHYSGLDRFRGAVGVSFHF